MRYFDISRLAKRATSHGPSGIDRVDLAYLQWLRSLGPVRYLVHGVGGFSEIDPRLGDSFADDLAAAWRSRTGGLTDERIKPVRDTSLRLRAAGKWRERRKHLAGITAISDLHELCQPAWLEKLDLLDASARESSYRVAPAWRTDHHRGVYFGVSHSMLGRTALLAALSGQSQLKRVFFIHDTIPCDFPEYCRAIEGHKHLLRLRNAFRYGTHLVVNSHYTAGRLEHWRHTLGAKELPVAVVPIGVDEGLREHAGTGEPDANPSNPAFIVLGTIEARKNHRILLDVWRQFAATLPADAIPRLLLVGKRGWENEEVFRLLDEPALKPHVEELNAVPDERLWKLIRNARAMLFPSFVEGWGMPMVEALTLGVPVIASDIPAFREAGADIPDLLPASDADAWARHILDYTRRDSPIRSAQLARLSKFRPPTWDDHFTTLLEWLGPASLGADPSRHRRD